MGARAGQGGGSGRGGGVKLTPSDVIAAGKRVQYANANLTRATRAYDAARGGLYMAQSDAARKEYEAAVGRTRQKWFDALDKAGAAEKEYDAMLKAYRTGRPYRANS